MGRWPDQPLQGHENQVWLVGQAPGLRPIFAPSSPARWMKLDPGVRRGRGRPPYSRLVYRLFSTERSCRVFFHRPPKINMQTQSRFVETNGIRMHYVEAGSGTAGRAAARIPRNPGIQWRHQLDALAGRRLSCGRPGFAGIWADAGSSGGTGSVRHFSAHGRRCGFGTGARRGIRR